MEKVEELKFELYDPETPITEEPAKSENDNGQKKTTENPNNKDVHRPEATNFNPTIHDISKTGKTEDDAEASLFRLPSVPGGTSDTQPSDEMDQDSVPTGKKPSFSTQRTYVLSVF